MHFSAVIAACLLTTLATTSLSAARLDTVLFVDVDGQSSLVQHTISSEADFVTFELPAHARFSYTHFMGPERQTFAHAWTQNPSRVALWSGSAILRYAHRKDPPPDDATTSDSATRPDELSLPGRPSTLVVEDGELSQWRVTFVFPSTVRPANWTPIDATGTWTRSGNTLSWHQTHGNRVPLRVALEYADDKRSEGEDPCKGDEASSDACAPDIDADGVPDHRDLCLEPDSLPVAERPDNTAERGAQDEFGCPPTRPLRLDGVAFQAGQSYLDVGSRRQLDRLAAALMHLENRVYQVGAHTDSEGSDSYNRTLSKRRAESVRRYLMLRGITPDRLQAAGYGEDYPRRSNNSVEGRRANRRVELKRLN